MGIIETYFREVAFVVDPELRLRAGTFDPALMRRFLSASGEHGPSNYAEELEPTIAGEIEALHR